MYVNYNGDITSIQSVSISNNRAFLYGDGVFETIKVVGNNVLFLEDHYFRLMSSMRIHRMEIPMHFTMEFLESEILKIVSVQESAPAYRVRITVYRDSLGKYLPISKNVSYVIDAEKLNSSEYLFSQSEYEIDLFKDYYVSKHLLSSVKSTNRIINVLGSIYANENDLNNCLLVNDDKMVVEALNGNIFMVVGNKVITPKVSDGCIAGVMRKQIISILKSMSNYEFEEASISSFDLQKADELFITNVVNGIQSVSKFRKKKYNNNLALELVKAINA